MRVHPCPCPSQVLDAVVHRGHVPVEHAALAQLHGALGAAEAAGRGTGAAGLKGSGDGRSIKCQQNVATLLNAVGQRSEIGFQKYYIIRKIPKVKSNEIKQRRSNNNFLVFSIFKKNICTKYKGALTFIA